MRVEILTNGTLRLCEIEDFKRFSVTPAFPVSELDEIRARIPQTLVFETNDVAWVAVAAVRSLAGEHGDNWDQRFHDMLEKVKPFGWFSEERQAIRAHVVWP